ncbi:MAG: dUTP diphosphatase [Clostridiales Family XIII bacterium]|nr:dUTP diphosphatase [Clostridiales Family XIII bacterium]
MEVRIRTEAGAPLPEYETRGSAGMDLKAYVDAPVTIAPGKRYLVPTGIYLELQDGYEAQIRARSGLAAKRGVTMANGVGTIDSDYRGEIKVALVNLGDEDFIIENGDRIAQMVIARYERVTWSVSDELSDTERGGGGFGHTGV